LLLTCCESTDCAWRSLLLLLLLPHCCLPLVPLRSHLCCCLGCHVQVWLCQPRQTPALHLIEFVPKTQYVPPQLHLPHHHHLLLLLLLVPQCCCVHLRCG
jgi:hypothetical protein